MTIWAGGLWLSELGGSGDVSSSANITDNSIVRGDGGVKGVQDSGVLIDDNDLITVPSTAGAGISLPLEDDATTPTLAFGDGDTGFYENSDDSISVSIAGVLAYAITSTKILSAGGSALLNESTSSTNPTLVPLFTDLDTGLGAAAADQLSLIAGGVEALRCEEDTAVVKNIFTGSYGSNEVAADPADPAEGQHAIWQSDGTGAGADGDIMIKITAGGSTKTTTLVDFSEV